MAPCSNACGYCGRCTGPDEAPIPFYCQWCNDEALDDSHWPYCGAICARYAEEDSQEDNDYEAL